jgi:hypothetical protein
MATSLQDYIGIRGFTCNGNIRSIDGHRSCKTSTEMFEFPYDNIEVCVPSHKTQLLQPLDRFNIKANKMPRYG